MHLAVILGLCSVVLAAPPLVLSVDESLEYSSERPNQTLPLNLTAPFPNLLPDPYDLPFPPFVDLHGFTEYYAWRPDSPLGNDAKVCGELALAVARVKPWDEFVGTDTLSYNSGSTYLVMHPREQMTWEKWSITLSMMQSMIRTAIQVQKAGFQFLVVEDGIKGDIGYGSLTVEEG